jgi:hypothetical protein
MFRFTAALSLLLFAFAAPAADARGLGLRHASARLLTCDQDQHTAAFRGSTWALARGTTLQMRFALQSRAKPGAAWIHSAPPEEFDEWLTAKPRVRHYIVDKTVKGLAEGVAYRVVVRFRWRDASGAVVDRAVRRTRGCDQPDRRADLAVEGIDVLPGSEAATRLYVVRVVNQGASDAPVFRTGLEVNGVALGQQTTTDPLMAGDWDELDFEGPPCQPGSSLTADTDTGGSVDEADEADNGLTVVCPGRK